MSRRPGAVPAPQPPDPDAPPQPRGRLRAGARLLGGVRLRDGGRLALLVGLLAAFAVLAATVRLPDLERIRSWTAALGPLAPVTFAVAYALAVPTPLPKSMLNAAAGLVFGIPVGIVVVLVGGTGGAVLSFLLARWLGRDAVVALTRGQVERVDATIARHGVLAALVVRFVPLLPFTMLNYACGVTAMRLRHYTLGTFVALVPGSSAWVVVGSLGGHLSPWFPAAVSVGLATLTLLVSAGWWWRGARAGRPAPSAPDA